MAGPLAGLSLAGAMGGVRRQPEACFGRDLTRLEKDGQLLLSASAPVSFYARLEDSSAARYIRLQAEAAGDLRLYCPDEPSQVLLDGSPHAFAWDAGMLDLQAPAGEHLIELNP